MLTPTCDPHVPAGYDIMTTSSRAMFQACQRLFYYRQILGIVPFIAGSRALSFGSVIHEALETWYRLGTPAGDAKYALNYIDWQISAAYPDRSNDAIQKENWHYAVAMMQGYFRRYPEEGFISLATEQFAWGRIINPATGRKASKLIYALKTDGIVQKPDGSYWILEHKTASSITGAYLERLWNDNQIVSYAMYLEQYFGIRIVGAIYNVLAKPKLAQSLGETEEQYAQRHAEACANSKNGKSSAKRKMPESDDEFQTRLAAWFDKPESFHREEILIDKSQTGEIRRELWITAQQYLWCKRTSHWSRNRNNCYAYNRRCGYWEICASRPEDEAQAIAMYAEKVEPHSELRESLETKREKV